jgi:hypothetical protein
MATQKICFKSIAVIIFSTSSITTFCLFALNTIFYNTGLQENCTLHLSLLSSSEKGSQHKVKDLGFVQLVYVKYFHEIYCDRNNYVLARLVGNYY